MPPKKSVKKAAVKKASTKKAAAKKSKKAPAKKTATKKTAAAKPAKKTVKSAPKKAAPKSVKKAAAKAAPKKAVPKPVKKTAVKSAPKKAAATAPKPAKKAKKEVAPSKKAVVSDSDSDSSRSSSVDAGGNALSDAAIANGKIIDAFKLLAAYTQKAAEPNSGFAVKAYKNAADALDAYTLKTGNEITSGKQVAHLKGIGSASVAKIDEFLKTGQISKLEGHKEEWGDLDDVVVASIKGSTKSGGGAASATAGKKSPFTAQVKKSIENKVKELNAMSNDTLKQMLRTNDQKITGNKTEMVNRMAHQIVLGALPRCPQCHGGKLHLVPENKPIADTVGCKGFFDDDVYRSCSFTCAVSVIQDQRKPWKNVTEEKEKSSGGGTNWMDDFGGDSD